MNLFSGQQGSSGLYRGEFAAQAGEVNAVNLVGTEALTIKFPLEGRYGVRYQHHVEPQVGGHARRGRNAVVGGQPGDDQLRDRRCTQPLFQVSADKGAVDVFGQVDLAGQWLKSGLKVCAALTLPDTLGVQRRPWRGGQVLNVHHRPAFFPPVRQKSKGIGLGLVVVPLSPAGVVEAFLNIDQQERGRHE